MARQRGLIAQATRISRRRRAGAQTPPAPFKKEAANYSEWAKGKFSEVVTVTNAQRTLYLAGVGSEDENAVGAAKILYPDSSQT